MKQEDLKWLYLVLLSLVWGSSFILMDLALKGLTPIQVGSLRVLITAFFLVIFAFKSIYNLSKNNWFWLTINALLGTFFPVYLFAYAINKMDSSIAAILNSLTPLNTLIFGALIFGFSFKKKQITGILIGLIGTILLIYFSKNVSGERNIFYMSLILIASVGYAINVNIIKRHLQNVNALAITTANFVVLIIPTIIVLMVSLKYEPFEFTIASKKSILYITILAIFGTAIAKTIFNKLVQISSPIFSTSVTYLIPIVAVFWGLYFGEKLNINQLFSGVVILLGVYLVNKV